MPTPRNKSVKAYAVLTKTGIIENADAFLSGDCCCCESSEAMAVYEKKRDAFNMSSWHRQTHGAKVVEVTITFKTSKPKK